MTRTLAKKLNSAVFPGMQGGPLMHVIAAKAVAFGEALRPSFKLYAKNVVENAKALAETLKARGLDIVSGGTDTHLMLVDLRKKRLTGKVAEAGAGPRPHHLQQERHPVRSGKADGHVGRPARHAGRHHARLRHRRVPAGRRTDRRSARCAGAPQVDEDAQAEASVREKVKRLVEPVPDLRGVRACVARVARASIPR